MRSNEVILLTVFFAFIGIALFNGIIGFVMGYKTQRKLTSENLFGLLLAGGLMVVVGIGTMVGPRTTADLALVGSIVFLLGLLPAMGGLGALLGGNVLPDKKADAPDDDKREKP